MKFSSIILILLTFYKVLARNTCHLSTEAVNRNLIDVYLKQERRAGIKSHTDAHKEMQLNNQNKAEYFNNKFDVYIFFVRV